MPLSTLHSIETPWSPAHAFLTCHTCPPHRPSPFEISLPRPGRSSRRPALRLQRRAERRHQRPPLRACLQRRLLRGQPTRPSRKPRRPADSRAPPSSFNPPSPIWIAARHRRTASPEQSHPLLARSDANTNHFSIRRHARSQLRAAYLSRRIAKSSRHKMHPPAPFLPLLYRPALIPKDLRP